jgi:Tfp pilus assembly protein PilV
MKSHGFTLIETALSLAMIAAGLLGLVQAIGTLSPNFMLADKSIVASNIARETLEKIMAQRDCNLSGCGYRPTLTSINSTGSYNANPVSGFPDYVLTTTALEVDPDSDGSSDDFLDAMSYSNYARVTSTVSWNSGANFVKLYTLLANY